MSVKDDFNLYGLKDDYSGGIALPGGQLWYHNGQYHCEDGPAVQLDNYKYKAWYLHGQRHRADGPAIEHSDGRKEWWIEGKQITDEKEIAAIEQKRAKKTVANNGSVVHVDFVRKMRMR